jgi:hypothetical protein
MTAPFWNHVARFPRHHAEHNPDYITEIIYGEKDNQSILHADLINLSRDGAQVKIDHPLGVGELVNVRIRCKKSGMELQLPAAICWQRSASEELWAAGCQFVEKIEWETYGELFLEGVLKADLPADD